MNELGEVMIRKSKLHIIFQIVIILLSGLLCSYCSNNEEREFKLTPKKSQSKATEKNIDKDFEVGTGWSQGDTIEATQKALAMALKGKAKKNPDFLIIYPTAGSDTVGIIQEARKIVGENTKIYGGTSDARGVFSSDGYVAGAKGGYSQAEEGIKAGHHGLVVMTISTQDIDFGVSAASLSEYASPGEMAAQAIKDAIESAGRDISDTPSLILVTPSIGIEQKVLDGIGQAIGNEAILLGGTAGGPDGMVIGGDYTFAKGVSIAVFYTDLPIGWAFESGFEKEDKYSGVVTKMDGRRIVEIDNKPAYVVYDNWLGGEVTRLRQQGERTDELRDFLSLHPLFRKRMSPDGKTFTVFSHPWAPNKNLITDGLFPTGDIKVGDRVYLSFGTWELLMNRIANLPENARKMINYDKDDDIHLAIGTICGGVMGVIPVEERRKFPVLINHENNNVPFVASFTWGEQGSLPGVGYQHCNLTTSFLVIGRK